jgi:hypothetical protein
MENARPWSREVNGSEFLCLRTSLNRSQPMAEATELSSIPRCSPRDLPDLAIESVEVERYDEIRSKASPGGPHGRE